MKFIRFKKMKVMVIVFVLLLQLILPSIIKTDFTLISNAVDNDITDTFSMDFKEVMSYLISDCGGFYEGRIYESHIDLIIDTLGSQLDLSFFGISDIIGIENFGDKLKGLNLDANNLTDIEPIKYLTNLEYLDLSRNKIIDISPLGTLINLKELSIHSKDNELGYVSHLEEISPLENLTNLLYLDLSNNPITDISALSNLVELQGLDLSYGFIDNIEALGNLVDLQILYLSGNPLNNSLQPLSNLEHLIFLDLSNCDLTNCSGLEGLSSLEELWMGEKFTSYSPDRTANGNQLEDISPLSSLITLEVLILDANRINNLDALSNLINLEELYLIQNCITDITGIQDLINLRILVLSTNEIEDISPLQNLVNLTWLELGLNKIQNIDVLENLTNLYMLGLDNNNISDARVLEEMNMGDFILWGLQSQTIILDNITVLESDELKIPLPYIFTQSQTISNPLYTSQPLDAYNALLDLEENSIILPTDTLGENEATVKILGGKADQTTLIINYNVVESLPEIISTKYIVDNDENIIYKLSNETTLQAFENNVTSTGTIKVLTVNNVELQNDDIIGTGMKLLLDDTMEYILVVTGDANGDGKFTITDMSRMISHLVERTLLTGPYLKALDVNYSGSFTITDASIMKKAIVDDTKF